MNELVDSWANYIRINSVWCHSIKYALDCMAALCGSLCLAALGCCPCEWGSR